MRSEFPLFDTRSAIPRTASGIKEIDAAVAHPSALETYLTDLRLEQAAARIALAHLYLKEGKTETANRSFREAGSLYISLFKAERESSTFAELGPKIAAGLLRSAMPVDALEVLKATPDSSARAYLTAEAFFSLGDRESAALSYEGWIASGCEYDPVMILNDEYGAKWQMLLLKQTPPNRCEQMPTELRSRMETLKQVFRHPANLASRNFPPLLVRRF